MRVLYKTVISFVYELRSDNF